jgi:hypothetical protein
MTLQQASERCLCGIRHAPSSWQNLRTGGYAMSNKVRRTVLIVFCLAVAWSLAGLTAFADDWDKATKITVNQPFEIPGMILPAGTYVVKIVDLVADRHVVRFLNEDQTTVYATLLAIPDFRTEATDNTAITFYEPEIGRPRALHTWFYPGHRFGVEFPYPEKRAAEIAAVTEEPVPAVLEKESAPLFREKPGPSVKELFEAPVVEVEPGGEEVAIAEAATEPAVEPTAEPEPPPLPKTATSFPLIALAGLLAAGAASGLRFIWK